MSESLEWRRASARSIVASPVLGLAFVYDLVRSGGQIDRLLGALSVSVLALFAFVIRWATTRYALSDTSVHMKSGLLTREANSVRFERIRSVDLHRTLPQRVLGIATVSLQLLGEESDMRLSGLTVAEARRVQAALEPLIAVPEPTTDDEVQPTADEAPLLALSDRLVFGAYALKSLPFLIVLGVVLLSGAVAAMLASGEVRAAVADEAFTFGAGTVISVVSVAWAQSREALTYSRFVLRRRANEFLVECGRLDTFRSRIRIPAVQAFVVEQPLFWRRFGWRRLDADVGSTTAGELHRRLLPVGSGQDVALVLAEAGFALPDKWTAAPRSARLFRPWSNQRFGYAVDDQAVHLRTGRARRHWMTVPFVKIQDLQVRQGPFQRRLGLASVVVDHAGANTASMAVRHVSVTQATELFLRLQSEAADARVEHSIQLAG